VGEENINVPFREFPFDVRFRVYWGIVWRAILMTLASAVSGGIAGGILGFIIGVAGHVLGYDQGDLMRMVQVLGGGVGLAIGLWFLWFYMHWIFRARFGAYRIQLVRFEAPARWRTQNWRIYHALR